MDYLCFSQSLYKVVYVAPPTLDSFYVASFVKSNKIFIVED